MTPTILIIFLIVLLAIGVSLVLWSIINGISPMPTSSKVKSELLSFLPADFEGKIYELGSGWGTLVVPLAKKFPKCHVIGFETSPVPFWFSKLWLKAIKLPNIHVVRKDFFSVNLSDADLVVCYLYPGAMRRLKEKFETELPEGTLVLTHTFAIPGWTYDKILEVNDLYRTKIYLYRFAHNKMARTIPDKTT